MTGKVTPEFTRDQQSAQPLWLVAPGDLPVPITDFPTDCSGVPDGGGTTGGDTDTGSTG